MKPNSFLYSVLLIFIISNVYAQRGKNGAKIITATEIVNEYAVLTANAVANDVSITVDNNTLNANNRFGTPLGQGDLIMIMQAQGAEIFGNTFIDGNGDTFGAPKDSSWGNIINYHNCGNYELVEVLGVLGGNTIQLNCGLNNNYTASGKVQVIRVPRYSSLTINSGATLSPDNWNGSKGGIVAVEVDGPTQLNGTISAEGKGFRGGVIDNLTNFGSNDVASTSSVYGGEKGESIAGFQNDYNIVGGRYCKGAPANGGGGGNMHNAGGGGGGNGGDPLSWIAVGNPSLATANWANAWNLEWPGLANASSSGGGKGGYTASSNDQNALVVGPNVSSWGGDNRNKQGGYGGRPLNYSSGKIFFGGAGGAGDGNDGYTGAGGNAGGIVYMLSYGSIDGGGTINCNGLAGVNSQGNASVTSIAGRDGAGGGGAGGTVFIQTVSTINGINIQAKGGNGGNQILTRGFLAPSITEAQGPGGGGGGGYVNTTVAATVTVGGGANGTTNSPSLTEFPPNGATSGGTGSVLNSLQAFDIVVNDETICAGNTVTLTANVVGTLPFGSVINWYDAAFGGNIVGTGNTFTTPVINSNTTYYVGVCPSTFTKAVHITTNPGGPTANAGSNQQICQNSTQLDGNDPGSASGLWTVISGSGTFADNSLYNTTVSNLSLGDNVFEWTIDIPGCSPSQSQVTITVVSAPVADAGQDQQICSNNASLNASGSGTWSVGSGTGLIADVNNPNSNVSNLSVGVNTFIWTVAVPGCPSSTDEVEILVSPTLSPADAGQDQQICSSSAVLNAQTPTIGTGTWTLVSGAGTIIDVNNNSTAVSNLGVGANVFEWTVSGNGCQPNSDQVTITVSNNFVSAIAGNDNTVCGNSTQLSANAPLTDQTGTWSSPTSGVSFTNLNDNNTTVNGLQTGDNILIWTVIDNLSLCPSVSDTVVINSVNNPSHANAGNDIIICDVTTTLNAIVPLEGTGLWTIISGSGTLADSTLANTSINSLSSGTTILLWTVSNSPCPSSSDTLEITVMNPLSSANAGSDASICSNEYTLSATTPTSGNGLWSVIGGTGTIQDPNAANTTVTNLSAGINIFQWTVSNGICPDNTDQVSIMVQTPPSLAITGDDIVTCSQHLEISANTPTVGIGTWTVTSGNANINSPNSPQTTVTILSAGGATFTWQITNGSCPPSSADITVTLSNSSSAANAGEDVTIALGDSTVLSGSGGTINGWDPPTGLSCIDCPNPIATPQATTMYYLSVTDDKGCTSIDSVLVTVETNNSWFLPNAFTPDNNGVNDILYFYGTGIKEFKLMIFDRWGEKVFETSDTKVGWDGHYKGKAAIQGVYAYVLTITFKNSKVVQDKGNINLIRNE